MIGRGIFTCVVRSKSRVFYLFFYITRTMLFWILQSTSFLLIFTDLLSLLVCKNPPCFFLVLYFNFLFNVIIYEFFRCRLNVMNGSNDCNSYKIMPINLRALILKNGA